MCLVPHWVMRLSVLRAANNRKSHYIFYIRMPLFLVTYIECHSTLCRSYFMWQTLLLPQDNLIECKLNIAQVEYKHLAQGDTLAPM